MKMKNKIKYIVCLCLMNNTLVLATLNVDQEFQKYVIGGSITEISGDIILITANNTVVDLNENTIVGGDRGIVVADNVSNCVIQNGAINFTNGDGVVIGQNCTGITVRDVRIFGCGGNGIFVDSNATISLFQDIIIDQASNIGVSVAQNAGVLRFINFNIVNCGNSAIQLLGVDDANMVSNILFEQIVTASCALLPTSTAVIGFSYANNVLMRDVVVNTSGNEMADVAVLRYDHCTECVTETISFINNDAQSIVGVDLIHTSSCSFFNGRMVANDALNGDATGVRLSDHCFKNSFNSWQILTEQSMTGTAFGFHLLEGSNGNIFVNCQVTGLIGNDVYGFRFEGTGTPTNTLLDVIDVSAVFRCRSQVGECIGIDADNADSCSVCASSVNDNRATLGTAVGMRMTLAGGGNTWCVNDCKFVRNIGVDDANSYGVRVESGTDNLFIKNFAFNNGATAGNQMSGVPAGSVVSVNTTNLNTAVEPWSNIVVTP